MHERPHLIRSVMEGISFSQWECVEVFREMGVPIEDMMICGGGGQKSLLETNAGGYVRLFGKHSAV